MKDGFHHAVNISLVQGSEGQGIDSRHVTTLNARLF